VDETSKPNLGQWRCQPDVSLWNTDGSADSRGPVLSALRRARTLSRDRSRKVAREIEDEAMHMLHPEPEAGVGSMSADSGAQHYCSDESNKNMFVHMASTRRSSATQGQGHGSSSKPADSTPPGGPVQLPPMSFSAFLAQQQLWSDLIGNLLYFPIALGFVGEAVGHPLGDMTCEQQRDAGLALRAFPCGAGSGRQVPQCHARTIMRISPTHSAACMLLPA
jgi:hypothetical protein